jgi:hypothetical protein
MPEELNMSTHEVAYLSLVVLAISAFAASVGFVSWWSRGPKRQK